MIYNMENSVIMAVSYTHLDVYKRQGMQSVDWFYTKEGGLDADEVYTSCPEAFAGDKIRLGDEFAGRDRYIWLQREITIHEEKEGCKVMGYFNFGRTRCV